MGSWRGDARARPEISWAGIAVALGLAATFYVAAAAAGADLRTGPQPTLAVSLNAGVVTALALVVRGRWLVAFLVAVGAVAVLVRLPDDRDQAVAAACVGVAAAVTALLFRLVATRALDADDALERQRAVLRLFAIGLLATVVNGLLVLVLTRAAVAVGFVDPGAVPPVRLLAGVRFAAQADGIATVTPLLLLLVRRGPAAWPARQWLELAAWVGLVAALTGAARWAGSQLAVAPVCVLLSLTAVLWAVLRNGSLAAAVLTPAFAASAAVMMTVLNPTGSGGTPGQRVIAAQVLGLAAAVTAWTVSSVVTQRDAVVRQRQRDLERRLASGEQRFAAALRGFVDPVAIARLTADAPGSGNPGGPGADLVVHHTNDAAATWGVRPGARLLAGLPETERNRLIGRLAAVYETGTPLAAEGVPLPQGRFVDVRAVRLDDDLLVSWRDVTARRHSEAELARRALHDPLTGVGNRHLLQDRLTLALRGLARDGGTLAVFYLDTDRFKDVNDSLGHDAGDAVLTAIAGRLSSVVRPGDTVARIAGDEFAVLAQVRQAADAGVLAERMYAAVHTPLEEWPAVIPSISIGVTTTRRPDADPDALLREADLAMYEAKHRGSRPWELFDPALHERAEHRLTVQADLADALDGGWFRLDYQPIVDLRTGRVVAAEALLRMQHPDRGLLTPDSFIDVAEDSDLILPIGAWVLRESLAQLHAWQQLPGGAGMQMSVNVSGRQLRRLDLPEQVEQLASAAAVRPRDVVIEITERVLVDAGPRLLTDLRSLTGSGVGLAVDDFGTGYSSLTYLKRFPVSIVKIDRSFVDGLGRDDGDTAIVAAVTGLARTLGLTAVAEGVESAGHVGALRDLGCHRAQGFHLGRPAPPAELAARIARQPRAG